MLLDGTAAAAKMARRSGGALRGERCRRTASEDQLKTKIIGAALYPCETSGHAVGRLTRGRRLCYKDAETQVPVLHPSDLDDMDKLPA